MYPLNNHRRTATEISLFPIYVEFGTYHPGFSDSSGLQHPSQ